MKLFFRGPRAGARMACLACALVALGCTKRPSEDELYKDAGLPAAKVVAEAAAPADVDHVNYRAIWGSSPNDVWAVGDKGIVAHYDGHEWAPAPSGTTEENLTSVWGTSPTEVWIASDKGTIFRWDGKSWTRANEIKDTVLLSVWASGPNDIWAVGTVDGEAGAVRHYNGSVWDQARVPGATSVWQIRGTGPHDVWMVGSSQRGEGLLLRSLDGKKFDTAGYKGPGLRSVWPRTPNDVWVAPYQGDVQRWDGKAWSSLPVPGKRLLHIDGSGPDDVWAVGGDGLSLHYEHGTWSPEETHTSGVLWSVWVGKDKETWAAGNGGMRLRWTGVSWAR
jgi:hypothetical protein